MATEAEQKYTNHKRIRRTRRKVIKKRQASLSMEEFPFLSYTRLVMDALSISAEESALLESDTLVF